MSKRRSLQSILIPSRKRSNTDITDYPPLDFASPADDLLDDDPFANLSSPTIPTKHSPLPSLPLTPPPSPAVQPPPSHLPPKSPLSAIHSSHLPPPPALPALPSKRHAVPAYQRPAFSPRPSLPSLHTLAKMSVVMPRKVRRGKVGAGLPSEPWDNLPSPPLPSREPTPPPQPDFTSELDVSEHEEDFSEDELLVDNYPSINDTRRLSASFGSDHFRTPSLSPERRPAVNWPSLDQTTHVSPDSELSAPAFPEFEDFETTSTSPPTTESDDSTSSEHSFEDDTLTGTSASTIRAPLHTWADNRTLFVGDSDTTSEMNTTDGNQFWRGRGIFANRKNPTDNTTHSHPPSDHEGGHQHRRDASASSTDSEPDKDRQGRAQPTPWNQDSSAANSEDDDVPLAQRIPTALVAQKSIRKQVRDERDQRRKERYLKRLQQQQSPLPPGSAPQPRLSRKSIEQEQARERHDTLRPAVSPAPPVFHSSSQDAAMYASQPHPPPPRARTQTLPGRPIAAQTLTQKLAELPLDHHASSLTRKPTTRASPAVPAPPLPTKEPGPLLRHARSFHRPSPRAAQDAPPVPLSRSVTRSKSTSRHDESAGRRRTSGEFARVPLPEGAHRLARNKSLARRGDDESHGRPPPPLPADPPVPLVTHRIHVGDLQTHNVVEVAPNTNAKDIIIIMEARGELKGWAGTGGWMLWEVCHDFGMERPIRTYEMLTDITASWKDKTANSFILKLTPLAPLLSRSNLPSSSPLCSGYIEYEYKRGKWTKRFLRLRENNLYLAKRDSGKDETFLCSLSNFDGYLVTRTYKAPKPFVFAIKSTDNLTFFENTADYMHVFSCNQKDGDNWIEKILLARSYVLYQEKNILFTAQSSVAGPSSGLQRSGTTLQRSGTRKGAPSSRAQAPLVDVTPQQIFEPGSLLHAKHA